MKTASHAVEFYIKFFELLAFDLVESLNTAYTRGQLSISQRRGVVTLIPKADSDSLKLTNWRPITLLNVASGRMARHMQISMSCYGRPLKRERSMKSAQ